jgi:hypothetical protein
MKAGMKAFTRSGWNMMKSKGLQTCTMNMKSVDMIASIAEREMSYSNQLIGKQLIPNVEDDCSIFDTGATINVLKNTVGCSSTWEEPCMLKTADGGTTRADQRCQDETVLSRWKNALQDTEGFELTKC